jgi:hypothetical protein
MRSIVVVVGMMWGVGCGGLSGQGTCEPVSVQTFDAPPIAAEGAFAPFTDLEVLAAPIPTADHPRTIEVVAVGMAPGWGCKAPHLVGAWVGEEPPALLTSLEEGTGEDTDMGEGFALRRVELAEPMTIPAGEVGWLGVGIVGAECGAKTGGEPEGARRWRQDLGWTEIDGRLVMGAEGAVCEP